MIAVFVFVAMPTLADNNQVAQPLTDNSITLTLMPTVGQQQQVQATVDTSPTITLTAEQFNMFRAFQKDNQTTVANNSSLGKMVLNGAAFTLVRNNEAQTFKTDTGFITLTSGQQANNGVEATLTLSGNYADRIVELRTTEQSQQGTTPVNFARMKINGIELGLVPQDVATAPTLTALKQNRVQLEAPAATTNAQKTTKTSTF
jgi:hypothetical protein